MKKTLIITLIIQCICTIEIKSQHSVIQYKDYRQFMIYTRDSIMRELLSIHFCDFSNYCELNENTNLLPRLKWDTKINFNHEEIVAAFSNMENYGYYNLLEKIDNEFFVNSKHLNYRFKREDKDSVNISINLANLGPNSANLKYVRFGLDNKCNNKIKKENIAGILTQKQIDAYSYWKNNIGLRNAKKMTKNKIIL